MQKIDQHSHVPVLLGQVLECLQPQKGETYLDLTAGYGGHASAVQARTNGWPMVLVDRDEMAMSYLRQRFSETNTEFMHTDFLTASQELARQGRKFDMILADLGVSSPHFNIASRGFSIQQEGPLDMRMDQSQTLSAYDVINDYPEKELADIIFYYGEEPKSRRIARAIVAARPIHSTTELANVIAKQFHGRSKVHPATKTFQAVRIVVNNELSMLEQAIPLWIELLKEGGRLAVISFHSLEDRVVKQAFAHESGDRYDARLKILTKRPLVGDKHELVINPRARSAKLRAAVKIKT